MALFSHYLLPFIVFLPLAGVAVLAFLPREEPSQHRAVAFVTTLVTFCVSLVLLWRFQPGVPGFQGALTVDVPWIRSVGVHFHMAIDGISLFLVLLTTFLTPIVVLSTFKAVGERTKEFMIAMLLLESGMLGTFLSVDMILFYVFWEAMLIPMYLLIGIWGGPRRIYSAFKFFLYTMVGSLLMLLAIIYLYFKHGTFDFQHLLAAHLTLTEQKWLFWAFVVAFAVKVPMVPVHTWLPDAHVEAPTAGSVILAGVLLKMGSYGLMRFAFPLFPQAAVIFAPILGGLAVVGIIYGAMMAIAQSDVKKLIAYSSVSHMGFVILGLCALTPIAGTGAVYQMLNHGVSSGALFLLVGVVYERRHTRLMSDYGGIARAMPVFAAFFLLVALSSAGLPGTNGFVGEFLILIGSFGAAPLWTKWATAIGATGVILGAVYLLWMYRRVFFGPLLNSENKKLKDLSLREWLVLSPLAVIIIVMGVYPKPFLERIQPSVDAYVGRVIAYAAPVRPRGGDVAAATGAVAHELGAPAGALVLLGPGASIGPQSARAQNPDLQRALAAKDAWMAGPHPLRLSPISPPRVIRPIQPGRLQPRPTMPPTLDMRRRQQMLDQLRNRLRLRRFGHGAPIPEGDK